MDYLFFDGEVKTIGHIGALDGPNSPQQIVDSVRTISPQHGPVYFLLLAGWSNFVGTSQFALRSLSLFFALLLIAFTYRLGREIATPTVGLLAGMVLGISFFLIDFTHSMRMYTMIPCVLAVEIWLFHRLIRPGYQPRRVEYALLALNTGVVLLTHYLGGLVLGVIGLYHLLFVRKDQRWLVISAMFVLGGLLFAPWVPVLITGMETRLDLSADALGPLGSFRLILYLFGNGSVVLFVGAAALAFYGLYQRQRGAGAIIFYAVVSIIVVLVANEVSPLLRPERARYLLTIWPVLALLIALGLAQLQRWPVLIVAVLGMWLVSGFFAAQTYEFRTHNSVGHREMHLYPPFFEIRDALQPLVKPGELFLGFAHYRAAVLRGPFNNNLTNYYLDDLGIDLAMILLPTDPRNNTTEENVQAEIVSHLPGHSAVWLMYEPSRPPDMLALYYELLGEAYQNCGEVVETSTIVIQRWIPLEATCT